MTTTIVTRDGKGSALTHQELDQNFENLKATADDAQSRVVTVETDLGAVYKFPSIRPSLNLDFAKTRALDPRIDFTRNSEATYIGPDGLIHIAGANVPRFDFDPITGECLGLLIEEQRINVITNSSVEGALAGSPGDLPTGWGAPDLNREIVGTGKESGIPYVDIRYSGSISDPTNITFEEYVNVGVSEGEVWTQSNYVRLVGGTLNNASFTLSALTRDGSGNGLAADATVIAPTSAPLVTQRFSVTATMVSGAAYLEPRLRISPSGNVDFTLRLGLPQLEKGAFASSGIFTTTAQVTRAAETVSMIGDNFISWFRQDKGSFIATAKRIASGEPAYVFTASDGTWNETVHSYVAVQWMVGIRDDGSEVASLGVATDLEQWFSAGVSYGDDSAISVSNGSLSGVAALNGTPAPDRLYIGGGATGGTPLNGHVARLAFYPTNLTNDELIGATV